MTWDDFQQAAGRAYLDGIDLLASIETLESGNRSVVVDGIRLANAYLTMHMIKNALMSRVHLVTVRAYQPARKDDMHMRAAIEAITKDKVSLPAHIAKSDFALAVRLFNEAAAHPALNSLEHVRHKELAHTANVDPTIGRPVIRELFEIAKLTASVGEALGNAAQVVTMPLQSQIDAHITSAKLFWDRWA